MQAAWFQNPKLNRQPFRFPLMMEAKGVGGGRIATRALGWEGHMCEIRHSSSTLKLGGKVGSREASREGSNSDPTHRTEAPNCPQPCTFLLASKAPEWFFSNANLILSLPCLKVSVAFRVKSPGP